MLVLDPCFKTYTTYKAILDVCTYSIGRKRGKGEPLLCFMPKEPSLAARTGLKQPYGSPKFMYFDGSVTWNLNISASVSTQTNAYALYMPNGMGSIGKSKGPFGRFPLKIQFMLHISHFFICA